jgi:hypothetical protein
MRQHSRDSILLLALVLAFCSAAIAQTSEPQSDQLAGSSHPHSEEMMLEERFQRVDHDTIEARMTLTDPKAYTAPWVSEVTRWTLSPNQKMREDICAPSDEAKYRDDMRVPAAGKK